MFAEDAPVDLGFALEFEGLDEPLLETPYEHRKFGHLINHLVRYTQICRAGGWIRHDGQEQPVDGWHAMRDHSVGMRSTMGPRTRARRCRPRQGRGRSPALPPVGPVSEEQAHRLLPYPRGRARGDPRLRGASHRRGGTIGSPGGLPARAGVPPGHTARVGGTLTLTDENGAIHELTITPSGTPAGTSRASGTTAAGTTAAAPASGAASGRSSSTTAIPCGPTYRCQARRTSRSYPQAGADGVPLPGCER